MITVHIKKIAMLTENEAKSITNALSKSARERLSSKRNEQLRLASVCALSLLSEEQRADLEYSDGECPYFATLNSDISISHSKNYSAVAISNSRDIHVGIDVENTTNTKIITRFFTESEKKIAINDHDFIEIWTKKESLFKFLKKDETPFIKLDSTTPKEYGAQFLTVQIENDILTICAPCGEEIEIKQK